MKITIFHLRKNMSNETLVKQIENYYKKLVTIKIDFL